MPTGISNLQTLRRSLVKAEALIPETNNTPPAKARTQASPASVTSRGKLSTPPPLDAPLMTRNDVAALLRTTPRQISNMMARGQIPPPVRVAGLGARWRRLEIDAWIAAQ